MKEVTKLPALSDALKSVATVNADTILQLKEYLVHQWTPRNASEAILMKNIQHVFNAAKDNINDSCAAMLDRCTMCDNERVDSITGLKVLRKSKPSFKVYNDSEEVDEIMAEMEVLKEKLKDAKERAGFTKQGVDGFNYSVKF